MPTLLQRAIHVAIGCFLFFLIYPASNKHKLSSVNWFDWILGILALASVGYLYHQYQAIMTTRGGIPNTYDIAFAIISVCIVLEAARRITGWILVIFALLFWVYPFMSSMEFMPQRLMTRPYDLGDIFGQLVVQQKLPLFQAVSWEVLMVQLSLMW